MDLKRAVAYHHLEARLGRTPLMEVVNPEPPNGCRVFAKCEFLGPTGSHHDRQFVPLLRALEEEGTIAPGRNALIEVSSGASGWAFAWACKRLDYTCYVIVPEELPERRVAAIIFHGAEVLSMTDGTYLEGCVKGLCEILRSNAEQQPDPETRMVCVNHTRRSQAVFALEPIVHEAIDQLGNMISGDFHAVVGMVGSGTSLLALATAARARSIPTVVAWEPFGSAVAFEKQNPGAYEERFGVKPGTIAHRIWGGSVPGVEFPHIDRALPLLTRRIQLIGDAGQFAALLSRPGACSPRGANDTVGPIGRWDCACWDYLPVGRSSKGNLAAAYAYAEEPENAGKNILTVFYDGATRY